jgi:hypothetical protein
MLEPRDVIVSGAPSGVGRTRTRTLDMKNSDVLEVEIEGLGRLRNVLADEREETALAARTETRPGLFLFVFKKGEASVDQKSRARYGLRFI